MSKKTGLKGTEAQIKTRTLLALWDLGAAKAEVKKGELTKRVQRTNEKAGDYKSVFEQLQLVAGFPSRVNLSESL